MGTVYRATDRLTRDTIALKQVSIPAGPTSTKNSSGGPHTDSYRMALAQEFKVLASLRHPNIISVLDYGFDCQRNPFFTMELLENAPNLIEAGQGQPFEMQVDYLGQTLRALAYLHRRGIVHRDLKPDNVLVVNGQVKVLDFGLAAARDKISQHSDEIFGTPAYMAPELIEGDPATEASDLYAIGMMAYEMFAGQYPFNTSNLAGMMIEILQFTPNARQLDISPDVAKMLNKVLSRSPQARYSSANEMIETLAQATQQTDLLTETSAVRESFLQAARFVGREAEFEQLVNALKQAEKGRGSTWLVGGESGVGKSRLIDEVRTQALVDGMLVFPGQAISEGGAPFQSWREVTRRLALESDLSPDEAAILKVLAGDIDLLLGQPVPDPPELDPQTTHKRLMQTVAKAFQGLSRPAVVVLEDMQWASQEGLALIAYLSRCIAHLPLLIIASYRHDERPDFSNILSDARQLKLPRLSDDEIAALSESILGDVGRQAGVVDLLKRETEGNTFFIVEVVRALAEEAGQLDRVSSASLPGTVVAGGMQQVLQRRLNRVPPAYQQLLHLAATYGREINLNVMQAIAPETDITRWLNTCLDASVLEIQDMCWRFSHDKLREQLLQSMSPIEDKQYHQRVAEGIEQLYGNNDGYAAALAHHWEHVGSNERAVRYLYRAGKQSMRSFAYQEAVRFFQKGLVLLNTLPKTAARHQQELDLQLELGSILIATQGYAAPEVEQVYARARELCDWVGQTPQLFPVLWGLTSFYQIRGDFPVARSLAEQMLTLTGQTPDDNVQMVEAHRMMGASVLFMGDLALAHHHFEQGVALYRVENHGKHVQYYTTDPGVVCMAYLAWTKWLSGYPDQAKQLIQQAQTLARQLEHPHSTTLMLSLSAFIYQELAGPAVVQPYLDELLALAETHGFKYWQAQGSIQLGAQQVQLGEVATGIETMRWGQRTYHETGSNVGHPYFMARLADAYCRAGEYTQAIETLQRALAYSVKTVEVYYNAEIHRIRGQVLTDSGLGTAEEIEDSFREAIFYARKIGAKSFELRAGIRLSRFLQQQERHDEARCHLTEIYNAFTEGFDTRDLREAHQILQNLSTGSESHVTNELTN